MSTFKQLQEKVVSLNNRAAILEALIEYLDQNFRSNGVGEPKMHLMQEDKSKVPEEAFEGVTTDLMKEMKDLKDEIASIMGTHMSPIAEQKPTNKK